MPCHVRSTSVSSRRHRQFLRRSAPSLPPLAILDLGQPAEREAHAFLLRATGKRDPIWRLLDMHRQASTLLCVVRWVGQAEVEKPFSLAEVSLTERSLCWQDYATADAARAELLRRCAQTLPAGAAHLPMPR